MELDQANSTTNKGGQDVCMYVLLKELITTLVLCARSQDLVMSVSVRRVHFVFSTVGFKGGGKPCRRTRETDALRRGIQKAH